MDDETLKKEFIFLKNALKDIARDISKNKLIDATFALGALYSLCNEHVFKMSNKIEEEDQERGLAELSKEGWPNFQHARDLL